MVVDARSVSTTTTILMVDAMWTYWVVECIILVTFVWNAKETTFWSTITVATRHAYRKCIKRVTQLY